MKKILFILLMVPNFLFAQKYSGDVQVEGKKASYLYGKAREWFAENHKSVDNAPFVEDVSNGKIKGNGEFSFMIYTNDVAINMVTYFNLVVSVKDNNYSYAFDNIMLEHGKKFPLASFKEGMTKEGSTEMFKAGGVKVPSKKMIETNVDYSTKVVNQCDADLERIISSLEEKMKS
jgi:hypothetical protein